MNFRRPTSRWALWAFVAALLLKSAMPWLASTSAEWQGKTLVEVCTVYGVSMVPAGDDGHGPAPDSAVHHGGEHCALNALTALASADPPSPVAAPVRLRALPAARAPTGSPGPDACATWVARLKHGPPASA